MNLQPQKTETFFFMLCLKVIIIIEGGYFQYYSFDLWELASLKFILFYYKYYFITNYLTLRTFSLNILVNVAHDLLFSL